jgi:hypothetical protein
MKKLSQQQAQQLAYMAKQAAAGIRLLVAENAQLQEKVAAMELQDRIDRVKDAMDRSGTANRWGSDEARDAALKKAASVGKLDVIEEAVRLTPDLSVVKMGELVDRDGRGESRPSHASKAQLDGWVLGGE